MIKETNEDLKNYLKSSLFIKIDYKGNIYVKDRNIEQLLHIFYDLKLAYLKESYEFKILYLLLQNDSISIFSIAKQLYISTSYARRKIKQINQFIHSFGFQICSIKGMYTLKGNEISIRLFFYILLNDIYHFFSWPYLINDLAFHLNFQQSLKTSLTILNYRKKNNTKIPLLNEKIYWVVIQLKEAHDFISDLKSQNASLKDELDTNEIGDYFVFFAHFFNPQIISKEVQLTLGSLFLNDQKRELVSKKITKKLTELPWLNVSEEKQFLLMYYLTLLECSYEIMGISFIQFEKLLFPPLKFSSIMKKTELKSIKYFLNEIFIKEKRNDLLENEQIQQYYCYLICTILNIKKPPHLIIYLNLTKCFTLQVLIQIELESIYNKKTVIFKSSFDKADLIITDSLNFEKVSEKEIFYFNTGLIKEQWELLLQKINLILLSKKRYLRKNKLYKLIGTSCSRPSIITS